MAVSLIFSKLRCLLLVALSLLAVPAAAGGTPKKSGDGRPVTGVAPRHSSPSSSLAAASSVAVKKTGDGRPVTGSGQNQPSSPSAAVQEFRPESLRLAGCRLQDGKVVLGECFDPGGADAIAIEAEDAVDVVADPRSGLEEKECSGGRCLVKLDRALFPIRVAKAGRYVRWSRGFFPQGGGWVHSESVDFGNQEWIPDCDGSTAGRWVWVKGPTYTLSQGTHLLWIHNWHGGARLDKILLAPEGAPAPEGMGPAATPRTPAREGWALTTPVAAPGLAGNPGVQWPFEARGGEVSLSLSRDGGRTYEALGPAIHQNSEGNGTAAASGAGAVGVASIQARALLRAAADGASPALGAPRVEYRTDPKAFVTLENGLLCATFLRSTGALVGLRDRKAGVECLAGSDGSPSFALAHLPPGAKKPDPVAPATIRLRTLTLEPGTLRAVYRVAGGTVATLTVRIVGWELHWTLDVDNRSSLDLVEMTCPNVRAVRLGARSDDDLLITPNWQGGIETADPVRSGGGAVAYPAGGAMAWLDLYEKAPAHGVTLSSHDPSLMGCVIGASAGPDADGLVFRVTRYAHVRPGKRWVSPLSVVGVHSGDWHTAADAYRTWARSWMRRPQPPEWVREADGWYGLVTSADSSRVLFRRIPDYLKQMRGMGTHYIQVWGQMTGGVNCDALPYPNPVLGTLDEFKAAIREVRRWGGHITFYVSSQFWRVDYGDAPILGTTPRSLLPASCRTWDWNEWRDYAIRSYGGEFSGDTRLKPEEEARYGTPWQRTVLCPATDAWANRHLFDWCVSQYGAGYGANGIYLDETAAASERTCFADNHGHEHHGVWGASLARTMQRMVEGGRKRDPEWMFAMEGCSDAIGQFADVNLISPASARKAGQWGAARRFAPEIFHYTFPEYILYDGVANGTWGGILSEEVFLNVHLHGNRYDAFSTQPAPLIALRRRTKQLLYRARFMDNVGIESADPSVRAKLNLLQDAANDVRLINLVNAEAKEGVRVRVAAPKGGPVWAYFFDLEGREGAVPLSQEGARVSFAAPTSKASTVLIAARCEPLVTMPVPTLFAGDRAQLRVTLTNPLPAAVKGRVLIEGKLFGQVVPPKAVTLSGQRSVDVLLPVAAPAGAPRRCESGHLRFEGAGATVRRPFDLLVESPFEASAALRGSTIRLALRNRSQAAHSGELQAAAGLWPEPKRQAFSLEAGGNTGLELPLPEGTRLTEPAEIALLLEGKGIQDRVSVWVHPPVENGGFERIGPDGKPAAWEYQNGDVIAMDTGQPFEGEVCLRIGAKPGSFVEAHQTLVVQRGGTYIVRCRVRRTPEAGRNIGPAIILFLNAGGERAVGLKKVTNRPDNEWNGYQGSFTFSDEVRYVALYLYNVDSQAAVWLDGFEVE